MVFHYIGEAAFLVSGGNSLLYLSAGPNSGGYVHLLIFAAMSKAETEGNATAAPIVSILLNIFAFLLCSSRTCEM